MLSVGHISEQAREIAEISLDVGQGGESIPCCLVATG